MDEKEPQSWMKDDFTQGNEKNNRRSLVGRRGDLCRDDNSVGWVEMGRRSIFRADRSIALRFAQDDERNDLFAGDG